MKSWRTTIGSIIAAAGVGLSQDPKLAHWGNLANIIGLIMLGAAARDNKVSSEQAGVKPAPPTAEGK